MYAMWWSAVNKFGQLAAGNYYLLSGDMSGMSSSTSRAVTNLVEAIRIAFDTFSRNR